MNCAKDWDLTRHTDDIGINQKLFENKEKILNFEIQTDFPTHTKKVDFDIINKEIKTSQCMLQFCQSTEGY